MAVLSSVSVYTETLVIEESLVVKAGKGHWEGSHYITNAITGGWTKYGGARKQTVINQFGVVGVDDTWYCQSCRGEQPRELTPYKYEYPQGDWIRVCAPCFNEGCTRLKERTG